jgi:hypothetical protein
MPLRVLRADWTEVDDLSALAGLPLDELGIDGCPVSDLGPLRGAPLRSLNCSGTNVSDLSPLAGMRLSALYVSHTRVADPRPLAGMTSLKSLTFDSTLVTDMGPLDGLTLERLAAVGAPLESLFPFETKPPRHFLFESARLREAYLEPLLQKWSRDPLSRHNATNARVVRAIRTGREEVVRDAAVEFGGHRYTVVPLRLGYEQAEALARRHGGHLLTVTSSNEQNFVASWLRSSAVGSGVWLWIGYRDGQLTWLSGEPMDYLNYAVLSTRSKPPPHYLIPQEHGNGFWSNRQEYSEDTHRMYAVIEWDQ